MEKRTIKVLVVDDSLVFRETFARKLSEDPYIEIIGKAGDVYEARDMIINFQPDVVTLDVEMPKMNGIDFLKRLMPQYPLPVIVVSAVSEKVFDALNAGAVDYVTKPGLNTKLDSFINDLIIKIKIAATAKVGNNRRIIKKSGTVAKSARSFRDSVIAIGASTGGTNALYDIIKVLPKHIPGIVIVQHMPPVFTKLYAERLDSNSNLEVKEAENGDEILPGRVIIAPGGFHMSVRKTNSGLFIETEKGTEFNKVNGHCPSVDVLFHSVAQQLGKNAIGVILTGMGRDGADGLLNMRKAGARTFGQNEESSIVYGMPKVAFEIGAVEKQYSLQQLPEVILETINEND